MTCCSVLPPEIIMHDTYISGHSENNIKCVLTISGGRTEELVIFCHVTGFTSDFFSFIVVEHILFFHGALQLRHNQLCCLSDFSWPIYRWSSWVRQAGVPTGNHLIAVVTYVEGQAARIAPACPSTYLTTLQGSGIISISHFMHVKSRGH